MSLIALEDVLQYTALSDLSVSPGGTRVLYRTHRPDLASNSYLHQLWLRPADGQPRALDLSLSGRPLWLDEDTMLHAAPGPDGTVFCRTDLASGATEELGRVPFPASLVARLDEDTLLVRGNLDLRAKELLSGKEGEALDQARRELALEREDCMVMDEFPYWFNGVGLVNKQRGCLFLCRRGSDPVQLTGDDFTVGEAVCCPRRRKVFFSGAAFTTLRPFFLGVWSLDLDTMERQCLMEEGKYMVETLALAGDKLVVAASLQEGNVVAKTADLYTVDPATGEICLLCARELSFGNSVCTDCFFSGGRSFAVREDKIYFLATVDEYAHLLCCDLDGTLTTVVGGTGTVDCFDLCGAGVWFVGLQDLRPQELYFQPWGGRPARVSGYHDAFMDSRKLAQPQPLSFVNREGDEIRGFVLKPQIPAPAGRYPAILDIHGGPLAAYGPVYFHEMQYWAAQGYYVLFCNPTGSTGRGQRFCDICGHSGETDYQDLMAFVDRALEAYPEIDPERLGVTGGSYGGFMTNWIIGHTGRFAAACSQRSTANNISNEAAADGAPLFLKSNLKLGETRDTDRLWDQSPLKYIDACVTPTLFLHSLEDYCCYHAESLQMYAALQRLEVPTRMVLFKHENHSLSRVGRPRSRLRRLREITAWMDRWLKPAGKEPRHEV